MQKYVYWLYFQLLKTFGWRGDGTKHIFFIFFYIFNEPTTKEKGWGLSNIYCWASYTAPKVANNASDVTLVIYGPNVNNHRSGKHRQPGWLFTRTSDDAEFVVLIYLHCPKSYSPWPACCIPGACCVAANFSCVSEGLLLPACK